jgi:FixJ family two-component response regulator
MAELSSLTIAVVDDDAQVLESVGNLLESVGATVQLYLSPQALLDDWEISKVDCLITDIGMPGLDGFELRSLALLARGNLPVILISARFEEQSVTSRVSGNPFFLPKPVAARDLIRLVRAATGRDQG